MTSIKRIVAIANLAADDQVAVGRAVDLARSLDASLHLHGLVYLPELAMDLFHAGAIQDLQESALEEAEIRLRDIVGRLPISDDALSTKVTWAHPFDRAVIEASKHSDADLVVFSPRGKKRFSSAEWRLIHRCPVPLLIARTSTAYDKPIITACVDPGQDQSAAMKTEKDILQQAWSLADTLKGSLEVCHALGHVPSIIGVAQSPEQYESELREARRGQILKLLPPGAPQDIPMQLPAQPFENIAHELCHERSVDLVVMSVIARSSITELLIGSAARKVLPNITCDVLVTRPR